MEGRCNLLDIMKKMYRKNEKKYCSSAEKNRHKIKNPRLKRRGIKDSAEPVNNLV
jgi:hypothetical protein